MPGAVFNIKRGHVLRQRLWFGQEQETASLEMTFDGATRVEEFAPQELLVSAQESRPVTDEDLGLPKGIEAASCRIEDDQVLCRALSEHVMFTTPSEMDPIALSQSEAVIGTLEPEETSAFVQLSGTLAPAVLGSGLFAVPEEPFLVELEVNREAAAILRMPFEVWTVELATEGLTAFVDVEELDVQLGRLWPHRFLGSVDYSLDAGISQSLVHHLVMPAGTESVACTATHISQFGELTEFETTLTQGAFIVTEADLRPSEQGD
jgi:hypothetical protein